MGKKMSDDEVLGFMAAALGAALEAPCED